MSYRVHTPCGEVQGTACQWPGIAAYKGIRYATAGRWEYPRPVTHWDGGEDNAQEALNQSALEARKRPIGSDGGWAYGGETSAPIEAAVIAYWAAKTTKRDPEGGCVIL